MSSSLPRSVLRSSALRRLLLVAVPLMMLWLGVGLTIGG